MIPDTFSFRLHEALVFIQGPVTAFRADAGRSRPVRVSGKGDFMPEAVQSIFFPDGPFPATDNGTPAYEEQP